jgi:hypothetical protein
MYYSKYILFTLIALVITDAFQYLSAVEALNVANATYISTFFNYISLFILIFIAYKSKWNYIPRSVEYLYKLWLIWNIFGLIHGTLLANGYWDWKFLLLSSLSFSLIPLVFFIGKNIFYTKLVFKFVLKVLFPLGFLIIPLALKANEKLYSRLMIPISLFILFIPYLKLKFRILIIIVALTSILIAIGFRSNIIKVAFSVILLLIYYFHAYIRISWLRFVHLSLFAIPIILFALAITNKFNLFYEMSNKEGFTTTDIYGKEVNFMSDTRTFLYTEVFSSLNKSQNWLIGKSAVGSYQSDFFYNDGGAMEGKRYGCEVGLLNILLRNGLIGVLVFSLLIFKVSSFAIYNSSNTLAKMLGLFIVFRWSYSFVEEYTQYDLNFYFFWLVIGLISSPLFRAMSDNQIKRYLFFR